MTALPRLQYHLVNAFTTTSPHSGNQASVVIFPANDPRATDDAFLLTTARDFGFAETAYIVPIDEEKGRWGLRWFTVLCEVPICGHATLAASKVILSRYPGISEIRFETKFWGELTAKKRHGGHAQHDENSLEITISLSTLSPEALSKLSASSTERLEEYGSSIAKCLGIKEDQVVAVGEYHFVEKSLIIELAPEVDLGAIKIDPKAVTTFSAGLTIFTQMQPEHSAPGVLRTHSRVIFMGDFEDPVTGAAHAFLTGYYLLTPTSERIPALIANKDLKSVALDGRQLSERGGKLYCELKEGGMVDITGTAAEWGTGTLTSW